MIHIFQYYYTFIFISNFLYIKIIMIIPEVFYFSYWITNKMFFWHIWIIMNWYSSTNNVLTIFDIMLKMFLPFDVFEMYNIIFVVIKLFIFYWSVLYLDLKVMFFKIIIDGIRLVWSQYSPWVLASGWGRVFQCLCRQHAGCIAYQPFPFEECDAASAPCSSIVLPQIVWRRYV